MSNFLKNEKGTVTVLSAAMMVAVLSCIGLAVDVALWFKRHDGLQTIADSAAVAGARELGSSGLEHAMEAASAYVRQRGENPKLFSIAVDAATSSVQVAAKDVLPRYFSIFLLESDPRLQVRAVAQYHRNRKLCALAMEESAQPGVVFRGDGELMGPSCVTWSNSSMPKSFSIEKAIDVTLAKMCAVGGAMNHSSGAVVPEPTENCEKQPDPLEAFRLSVPAGCDHTNFNSSDPVVNLTPGTYCGGITISSDTVRAAPGIYYIKDGDVAISGSSDVIFQQATIYLSGSKLGLSVKGDSRLIIDAPRSGPSAEVAVAMDPAGVPAKQTYFGGSSRIYISGAIHVPKQKLVISGDSVGVAELDNAVLIAGQIDFGGGAQWKWTNTDRLPNAVNDVNVKLIR